jgi:hypothetical protein
MTGVPAIFRASTALRLAAGAEDMAKSYARIGENEIAMQFAAHAEYYRHVAKITDRISGAVTGKLRSFVSALPQDEE